MLRVKRSLERVPSKVCKWIEIMPPPPLKRVPATILAEFDTLARVSNRAKLCAKFDELVLRWSEVIQRLAGPISRGDLWKRFRGMGDARRGRSLGNPLFGIKAVRFDYWIPVPLELHARNGIAIAPSPRRRPLGNLESGRVLVAGFLGIARRVRGSLPRRTRTEGRWSVSLCARGPGGWFSYRFHASRSRPKGRRPLVKLEPRKPNRRLADSRGLS